MILTVFLILALVAFACSIAAAVSGRVPLWVAVLLLTIIELLRAIPMGGR